MEKVENEDTPCDCLVELYDLYIDEDVDLPSPPSSRISHHEIEQEPDNANLFKN